MSKLNCDGPQAISCVVPRQRSAVLIFLIYYAFAVMSFLQSGLRSLKQICTSLTVLQGPAASSYHRLGLLIPSPSQQVTLDTHSTKLLTIAHTTASVCTVILHPSFTAAWKLRLPQPAQLPIGGCDGGLRSAAAAL